MKITKAEYFIDPFNKQKESITAVVDGVTMSVPISESNRHYVEILKQVKEGTLTIKDAE